MAGGRRWPHEAIALPAYIDDHGYMTAIREELMGPLSMVFPRW
jgi:hypothetical protein